MCCSTELLLDTRCLTQQNSPVLCNIGFASGPICSFGRSHEHVITRVSTMPFFLFFFQQLPRSPVLHASQEPESSWLTLSQSISLLKKLAAAVNVLMLCDPGEGRNHHHDHVVCRHLY